MLKFLKKYKVYIYPLSFIFGAILSSGILSFNAGGYVNIFYFLLFLVVIPFFITFFGFVFRVSERYSALAGVLFSVGALVAILVVFAFKYVPFGWSSTMDISAEKFYEVLSFFAFWKGVCSECAPTLELVRQSHYPFSSSLEPTMLGQWWKFLAMSLFVYGVLFRFLIYLFSLKSSSKLVEIVSNKDEENFTQIDSEYEKKTDIEVLKERDFRLFGYYVDVKTLGLKQNPNAKDIVIAVKSYEPPVLDFFDYLDEIKEQNPNSNISILLTGLKNRANQKDVDIWTRKLKELKYDYVEVLS